VSFVTAPVAKDRRGLWGARRSAGLSHMLWRDFHQVWSRGGRVSPFWVDGVEVCRTEDQVESPSGRTRYRVVVFSWADEADNHFRARKSAFINGLHEWCKNTEVTWLDRPPGWTRIEQGDEGK
jgi:hypothetical protein